MIKCFCGWECESSKELYPHLISGHTGDELLRYINDPDGVMKEYESKRKQ